MQTSLTQQEITNFWIRCYLGDSKDIYDKCIKRAYLDLNRTIHNLGGIDENIKTKNYIELVQFLRLNLSKFYSKDISSQDDFDKLHKEVCEKLQKLFNELYNNFNNVEFHYGQAQKWINMALKYLFAIGENFVRGISNNYQYYHIPIDNIIREKLGKLESSPIKIPIVSWSRLNYMEYMDYQLKVRKRFVGEIPLDVEFRLFNGGD